MGKFIDKEELMKEYKKEQERPGPWRFETLVDSVPVIDVDLVIRAKWKYFKKKNKAVCTNCSFERDLDENFGRAVACPNCGAKMDLTGADE